MKKIETKKQHANVFHLIQNDKACTCCTNANAAFFSQLHSIQIYVQNQFLMGMVKVHKIFASDSNEVLKQRITERKKKRKNDGFPHCFKLELLRIRTFVLLFLIKQITVFLD